MLYHYFGRGMTVDMLDFTGVQTQSYDSSGVEYIDFPLDELPEPMGDDLWWKVLPSSGKPLPHFTYDFFNVVVSLRVTPPPPASSHMTQESLDSREQPPSPSPDVVIVTAPDTIMRPKRKRTAMSGGPKRAKRRIFESSEDESSEDENNVQAEPSTQSRGKDNVDAPIPKAGSVPLQPDRQTNSHSYRFVTTARPAAPYACGPRAPNWDPPGTRDAPALHASRRKPGVALQASLLIFFVLFLF